jgi:hypothetical protein
MAAMRFKTIDYFKGDQSTEKATDLNLQALLGNNHRIQFNSEGRFGLLSIIEKVLQVY